jgi:hypothetical protein
VDDVAHTENVVVGGRQGDGPRRVGAGDGTSGDGGGGQVLFQPLHHDRASRVSGEPRLERNVGGVQDTDGLIHVLLEADKLVGGLDLSGTGIDHDASTSVGLKGERG